MTKAIELYKELEITKLNEYFEFTNTNEEEYRFIVGEINFTILLLEIKSICPPTDCIIKLNYSGQINSKSDTTEIHLIKYRKNFIFENGIYILYLDTIDEIPKDIRPIKLWMENKRDPTTTAKLFYRANFQIQPM